MSTSPRSLSAFQAEFVRVDLRKTANLKDSEAPGWVGHVILNRADLHNAFNDQMIREMDDAFQVVSQTPGVRVIVLSGEGKSFCAGADLNWMKKMVTYTLAENQADAMALSQLLKNIYDIPQPVIAKVHGAAFGGGVGLTAVCDMAIALDSVSFSLSEVKLGILPAVISPFVMQKIGGTHARRYFLTAERFKAQEAKRIGLVSEVVSSLEEMDEWITGVCDAIIANGPEAVSVCKKLIDEVEGSNWNQLMTLTTSRIAERRISAEGQEGMKAFLEKRTPAWLLGESSQTGASQHV